MLRFLRDLIDVWRFHRRYKRTARHVRALHKEILRQFTEPIPPPKPGEDEEAAAFWIGVDPMTGRDASNLRFLDPQKERQRREKG